MPDGTSNGGLAFEREALQRRYDPVHVAQQHADRQAVVDGGLFPPMDPDTPYGERGDS